MSKSIKCFLDSGIDIPKNDRDAEYVYKIIGGKNLGITYIKPKKTIYKKYWYSFHILPLFAK